MTYMAHRIQHFTTSVFAEMTALANQHHAVNLGQGFPDFPAPDFIKEAAQQAIMQDVNQYAPSNGRSALRHALAEKYQRHYQYTVNPDQQIIITHGATEAIFATILALVDPGDEVIVFEPFYDSYLPSIQMAGGIPRFYTLRPPDWAIDLDELAALFSDKTKLILINTPHNPTGKLFSPAEMQAIADLCHKHDVIAITDEVYEHLVYDGQTHNLLATLPGMADRTVTISSMGKTFSVTGWKVGWTIASPDLTHAIFRTHQFITFSGSAPLQEAAATAVAAPDSFYTDLIHFYQQKRDFLLQILDSAGLHPIKPAGTYFIMTDISHLHFEHDVAFCRYLTSEIGVAAIPPSAFYHNPTDGATLARFAFCKTDTTLQQAAQRLQTLG